MEIEKKMEPEFCESVLYDSIYEDGGGGEGLL